MKFFRLLLRLALGRRLPRTQGTLQLAGLHGEVRIHRDRHGIALIEVDDARDSDFALGFCHGQDRAFQLEVLLRVTRGQVAALIGPAALPVDRLSRRIGFLRSATRQWNALSAEVQQSLRNYAAGVCAGSHQGCSRIPHEFVLLGGRPTPWTPLDSLAVTKLLSFTLMANWDAELVRLKVLLEDGPGALRALDPSYPEYHPVSSPVGAIAGKAIDALSEELALVQQYLRPGAASNNWALAPQRTANRQPLLACDPHLAASLPSPWYLASVSGPGLTLAGGSFVGGPLFLIGHNGHAAWGVTAGLVDNTDLFMEEIGPDQRSIRQGDTFVACAVEEEVIPIKGAEPHTESVLITPRGPIVSPVLADTSMALSMRATWLDPLPIRGFFEMASVRSFEQFRQAFADWPLASLNLVYADQTGSIGWQLVGRVPVRKHGVGKLPLPGWDPHVGWLEESVPFAEHPFVHNPDQGWVATANTPPVPAAQGRVFSGDFVDGYRLAAITRALQGRSDWDVAGCLQLQTDQTSLAWEEMRPAVLAVSTTGSARQAQELLGSWDGRLSIDSTAAAVYELFVADMVCRVAAAKAPRSWQWVVGMGLSALTRCNFACFRRTGQLAALLREQPAGWFERGWAEEIADALGTALEKVSRHSKRGTGWGRLRPLILEHPLGKSPGLLGRALASVFNLGPVPCGGDCDVINQAAALPLHPLGPSENVASLRAVFAVGAWEQSRFVIPAGQSGNPFSPHQGDLLPLWQQGQGVAIACEPISMRQAAEQTLILQAVQSNQ